MSEHEPCCDACGGTGTASEQGVSGRCWDCYGTGCAHPPLDHIDRAAEVIFGATEQHMREAVPSDCDAFWADAEWVRDAARALDAAGLLRRPTDPEVHVEATGTGRTCVVKVSGQTIFDGVGREALIRTKSAAEHDAATAAKALRDARSDIKARIQTMQECGAHSQYMAALNDAWGLLSNRLRDIERDATT